MDGGLEARRSPLRALRRGLAVFVLVSGGLFGLGMTAASADTCITLICLPSPTPLPTILATPLPTLSLSTALPTVTGLPTLLATTSTSSSSTDLPLSTPDLGGLLGGGTTTTTSSSSTSSDPLGGLVDGSGSSPGTSCGVSLPGGVCLLPSSSACPAGSTDPSCLVSIPSTNPGCTTSCPPSGGGPGGGPGGGIGGSGSGGDPLPTGTFSAFGGGSLAGGSAAPGAGPAAIPLGLSVPKVPAVEQLSPVSGLQFGHALILWPLFGLLDVLGLAAVYLVVRRFRVRSD